MSFIEIKNCNTNNLKNVSLKIPMGKISCFAGPSGSGKSSVVFHTLANESKRRFLNSLPSDVTFFDKIPQSAEVDSIEPVLPVWTLAQNNPIVGSRLNLMDQLELTTDIAKLFFDMETNKCLIHHEDFENPIDALSLALSKESEDDNEIIHLMIEKGVYQENVMILPSRSMNYEEEIHSFDEEDNFYEIIRVKKKGLKNLKKKIEEYSFIKEQKVSLLVYFSISKKQKFFTISNAKVCRSCEEDETRSARSLDELLPFNGVGACPKCKGYGTTLDYAESKLVKYPQYSIGEGAITVLSYSKFNYYESIFIRELKRRKISIDAPYEEVRDDVFPLLMDGVGEFPGVYTLLAYLEEKRYKRSVRIYLRGLQVERNCSECEGTRLSYSARSHIHLDSELALSDLFLMTADQAYAELSLISKKNFRLKGILKKLQIAIELGLGNYPLNTKLKSLETNEYQKSLLARYFSYESSGSLFVLDEPSLGLDVKEQKVLVKYLKKLTPQNTVVIVDHAEELKKNSDVIFEMGPGAGHLGGELIYEGDYKKKRTKKAHKPDIDSGGKKKFLKLSTIQFEDTVLKEFKFPLDSISVIHGQRESHTKKVVNDVIASFLSEKLYAEKKNFDIDYSVAKVTNLKEFEDIIVYTMKVDRASGRSTVGTMLGLTPEVRKYFAALPVSKNMGLEKGHFSPNSDLGKCKVCEGKGRVQVDMQFMEDINLTCEECDGKKLNKFFANISDGKYTVHEAYNTPVSELFEHIPRTAKINRILEYLKILNLDYLTLDRSLPSLSGGERLRIKFLNSLLKKIDNSLLIFSNISYGLSVVELNKILIFLAELTSKGNTILLIDNHPIFKDFHQIEI